MDNLQEQEELIKQGYEILQCPRCNKECKPVRINKDESVTYETHDCQDQWEISASKRSFKITADGDLKMR